MGMVLLSPQDCLITHKSTAKGKKLKKKSMTYPLDVEDPNIMASSCTQPNPSVINTPPFPNHPDHPKPQTTTASRSVLTADVYSQRTVRRSKSSTLGPDFLQQQEMQGNRSYVGRNSGGLSTKFSELRKLNSVPLLEHLVGVQKNSKAGANKVGESRSNNTPEGGIKTVVILQRPKTKEAADKLLARFCKNVAGKSSSSVEPDSSHTTRNFFNACRNAGRISPVQQASYPKLKINATENVEQAINLGGSSPPVSIPKEADSGGLNCPERWAGPSFSVSPPPSSLPLPKFLKSCEFAACGTAPSSSSSSNEKMGKLFPCEGCIDVAFATRDLRRILNLDV